MAKEENKKSLRALTALRFFLILCVVLNHGRIVFPFWGSVPFNLSQSVSFFFLLSGFILMYSTKQLTTVEQIVRFYFLRLSRVWPLHAFCLVLLLFLLPEIFRVKMSGAGVFLSNLFLLHAWVPILEYSYSYNSPSWSLSTMLFFYLLFPWLQKSLERSCLPILAGALFLSVLLICICENIGLRDFDLSHPSVKSIIYINPLCRLLEFVVGMTAAIIFRKRMFGKNLSFLEVTLTEISLFAGVVYLSANGKQLAFLLLGNQHLAASVWLDNCGFVILPFALFLMALASEKGILARLLSLPAFVWLGRLSFSIYMLHAVLIMYHRINLPQKHSLFSALLFLLILIMGAHLLHNMVERPVRKLFLSMGDALLLRVSA